MKKQSKKAGLKNLGGEKKKNEHKK